MRRRVALLGLLSLALVSLLISTPAQAVGGTCPTKPATLLKVQPGESVRQYSQRLFAAGNQSKNTSIKLKTIIDPALGKPSRDMVFGSVQRAANYWSRFSSLPRPLTVLLARDATFVRKSLKGSYLDAWKTATNDGRNEANTPVGKLDFLLLYNPRGYPVGDVAYQQVGAHELFHYFQYLMSSDKDQKSGATPVWLEEGSATFFSTSLMEINGYAGVRDDYINRLNTYVEGTNGRLLKLQEFTTDKLMDFSTDNKAKIAQQVYPLGLLASELFVSKAGVEGLAGLFTCMADGKQWSVHFQTLTGQSPAQFLREANAYINEVFSGREPKMK